LDSCEFFSKMASRLIDGGAAGQETSVDPRGALREYSLR
jgi:hypothetical protein